MQSLVPALLILLLSFIFILPSSYAKQKIPRGKEVLSFIESLEGVEYVRSKDTRFRLWSMWIGTEPALVYVSTKERGRLGFIAYWWKENTSQDEIDQTKDFIKMLRNRLVEQYPALDLPTGLGQNNMIGYEGGRQIPNTKGIKPFTIKKETLESSVGGNTFDKQ